MNNLIQKFLIYDSAEISDALDSLNIDGALLGLKPIVGNVKMCGYAFTVKYAQYQVKPLEAHGAANYIDDVPAGSVIVVDNAGSDNATTWGDILTRVALNKHINGTVVNGAVRDIEFIIQSKYPLFTKHIYMRSGKNRVYLENTMCNVTINQVVIKPGDIIFGDMNGVLVVPVEYAKEVLNRAYNIKQTEEKIIQAVTDGMALSEARTLYRYDKPWLQN